MSASNAFSVRARRRGMLLAGCAVALPHAPALAQSALMGSHVTQLGNVTVVSNGVDTDTVTVSSPTAIVNWTPSNPSNAGVVDFLPAGKRACEAIRQRRVLIGGELALPGPVADGVGADRPEIRTAADQRAVAQDDHPAVAALHAVKHMHVERVKPIPH